MSNKPAQEIHQPHFTPELLNPNPLLLCVQSAEISTFDGLALIQFRKRHPIHPFTDLFDKFFIILILILRAIFV